MSITQIKHLKINEHLPEEKIVATPRIRHNSYALKTKGVLFTELTKEEQLQWIKCNIQRPENTLFDSWIHNLMLSFAAEGWEIDYTKVAGLRLNGFGDRLNPIRLNNGELFLNLFPIVQDVSLVRKNNSSYNFKMYLEGIDMPRQYHSFLLKYWDKGYITLELRNTDILSNLVPLSEKSNIEIYRTMVIKHRIPFILGGFRKREWQEIEETVRRGDITENLRYREILSEHIAIWERITKGDGVELLRRRLLKNIEKYSYELIVLSEGRINPECGVGKADYSGFIAEFRS